MSWGHLVESSLTAAAAPGRASRYLRDYQVYGILLSSEIPLRLPEQPARGTADVTLLFASPGWFERIIADLPASPNLDDWYERVPCPDGSDFLRWPGLFEFLVSADGRSVFCRALEGSTVESFQTYLLGLVLSFALIKQGHEPLHATAVVIDGVAVALLGASGQGKSTLAAAFLHAGHQMLTDDLLLTRRVAGRLCGFAGPPRIKLFPNVALRFLPDCAPLAPMNPNSNKLVIPLEPEQWHAGPAPLHAFLVLDGQEGGRFNLRSVGGAGAGLELLAATFNKRLVGAARLRRQFVAAREWNVEIPIKRATYDWTIESLNEVCQAVAADVRSNVKVSA